MTSIVILILTISVAHRGCSEPTLWGPEDETRNSTATEVNAIKSRKVRGWFDSENCREPAVNGTTGDVIQYYIEGFGMESVYCDYVTDGGNWAVIQRRMDGSVDFNRNWDDYVNGFGDEERLGEHWLGLEALTKFTDMGHYHLRIDMTEMDGTHYYAEYTDFKVLNASYDYQLRVSGYSGNATDPFAQPVEWSWASADGTPFSTWDRDNDNWPTQNCAIRHKGGWWHKACNLANLNGLYNAQDSTGILWYHYRERRYMILTFVEMKIRVAYYAFSDD